MILWDVVSSRLVPRTVRNWTALLLADKLVGCSDLLASGSSMMNK